MEEIKNPEKKDYEKIQRFLESVYGHSYNYFPLAYPHLAKKENMDFSNILVIEREGKICSLVRIFPLITYQNGIKLKIGGIGSVSTDIEERGKGYMTALLNKAIEKMKNENYPISILWGDRHRYINFGYEIGGKNYIITITTRGLEKLKINSLNAKRYLGEKQVLNKIIEEYEKKEYRVERTYEYFYEIYKKINTATYYYQENEIFGYVVIGTAGNETHVFEYGGRGEIILGILKYISEKFGKTKFYLEFPDLSYVPEIILKAASSWHIVPSGMIKIINFKKMIEDFLPLIEKNFPDGEEISFNIENQNGLSIKKENRKMVIRESFSNQLNLKEDQAVRLFFGQTFTGNFGDKIDNLLNKFLPLNFFYPIFDHV